VGYRAKNVIEWGLMEETPSRPWIGCFRKGMPLLVSKVPRMNIGIGVQPMMEENRQSKERSNEVLKSVSLQEGPSLAGTLGVGGLQGSANKGGKYLGTIHKQGDETVLEVDVFVTGYPAQFYRFDATVVSKESDLKISKVSFSTGSGSFSHFWMVMEPMLKMMADGMMTVQATDAL